LIYVYSKGQPAYKGSSQGLSQLLGLPRGQDLAHYSGIHKVSGRSRIWQAPRMRFTDVRSVGRVLEWKLVKSWAGVSRPLKNNVLELHRANSAKWLEEYCMEPSLSDDVHNITRSAVNC
jgi:hypothetical protein